MKDSIKRLLIKYLVRTYGYELGEGMYQHGYETGKTEVYKKSLYKRLRAVYDRLCQKGRSKIHVSIYICS